MYVTKFTRQEEIRKQIAKIEELLKGWLKPEERIFLHEELDYLESFLDKEVG